MMEDLFSFCNGQSGAKPGSGGLLGVCTPFAPDSRRYFAQSRPRRGWHQVCDV